MRGEPERHETERLYTLDLMHHGHALLVYFFTSKRPPISFSLLDPLGQYSEEGVMIFFIAIRAVIASWRPRQGTRAGALFGRSPGAAVVGCIPAVILTIILNVIAAPFVPGLYMASACRSGA